MKGDFGAGMKHGKQIKVGSIVSCMSATTLEVGVGIVVDEGSDSGPFGMKVWKVLFNGAVQQFTDAGIREVLQ